MDEVAELICTIQGFCENIGLVGTIAVLLIIVMLFMFITFTKQIASLALAITILSDKVSSPYLDLEGSLHLFKAITTNTIHDMLTIVGDVLYHNSIATREAQIRKNVKSEYCQLLHISRTKLAMYKSVCGDMGEELTPITECDKLLVPIFDVLFSDYTEKQKIADIKTYLYSQRDALYTKIGNKGVRN